MTRVDCDIPAPEWVTAGILAGGQGTRMGAVDKGLCLLAGRLMIELLDLGVARGEPAALHAAFAAAGDMADIIITSAGVSVGAADHVRTVLAELGEIRFWKVSIKPGKPFAFGQLTTGPWFFGLPGNPVAAMVTFYQLVQPALEHLAGAEPRPRL